MKKLSSLLSMLLMVVLSMAFASCNDDDDKVITENQLPAVSRSFVSQYFPTAKIVYTTKDKNEYEITLSDGTRIDFNQAGEWTDVDAPVGTGLPTGFYPSAIDDYLAQNHPENLINEISKERHGYDVELISGLDLKFSADGTFISIEH